MERFPYLAAAAGAAYQNLPPLPVAALLDDIRSLYNVGSFFRIADCAGVRTLYLTGITGRPPSRGIHKTALGAEDSAAWEYHADPLPLMENLRRLNWQIAALETGVHSIDLFDWRPSFPVCVVFGNEITGIHPRLLDRADLQVRIPTLGAKHSLNVAAAGAVVIYELLRKYRCLVERPGG
ncbi:MAG: RNA methyltransferase [Bryobacteraceae bacterium]|nr:RNA methyltransferase [Bryobacteraceae bacterium]